MQQKFRNSDSHLCYSGLFLLELTEPQDANSWLIMELLIKGVEKLHMLPKTGTYACQHHSQHMQALREISLSWFGLCCHLTCTQTPGQLPATSEHWRSLTTTQTPAAPRWRHNDSSRVKVNTATINFPHNKNDFVDKWMRFKWMFLSFYS